MARSYALPIWIDQACCACGNAKGQPCKAREACARLTAAPKVTLRPTATLRPPWSPSASDSAPQRANQARRHVRRDAGTWQAFGNAVRSELRRRGLTQGTLGDRLGVSAGAVNHWLTGFSPATPDRVDRIIAAIGDLPPSRAAEIRELAQIARQGKA